MGNEFTFMQACENFAKLCEKGEVVYLNYGECLQKIRSYCIDKKINNEILVNEPLEDLFSAARLKKQKGPNKGEPFYYEYSQSSRIVNNELEISHQIRDALCKIGMEEIVEESVQRFFDDRIDKNTIGDMIDDFSTWLENSSDIKKKEVSAIKSLSNDPGLFLAKIVVRSLKEPNLKQNEGDSTIWCNGNNYIRVIKGDLFTYAIGRRSQKTRIVVIPVNTSYDTHLSTKAEGEPLPLVSKNTIHEQILYRLSIKGIKEDVVRQRIIADLKANSMIIGNEKEMNLPIGTIATLEVNNSILYLLAISVFDENNNARSSKKDIRIAIQKLLEHYDRKGQGYDMFLPLMGTGMSRAGLDNQESYDLIIKTLLQNKKMIHGGINIVIKPEIIQKINVEKGEL